MGRSFGLNEFLYLIKAIPWTLALSLGALIGGGVVGLFIASLRTAPSRILRGLATGYIELFQGTPVLMQLFVTYYGLAVVFDLQVDAWPADLLRVGSPIAIVLLLLVLVSLVMPLETRRSAERAGCGTDERRKERGAMNGQFGRHVLLLLVVPAGWARLPPK